MGVYKVNKNIKFIYYNGNTFKCEDGEVIIPDKYDKYFKKYYEEIKKKKTIKQKEEEKDVNGIQ